MSFADYSKPLALNEKHSKLREYAQKMKDLLTF